MELTMLTGTSVAPLCDVAFGPTAGDGFAQRTRLRAAGVSFAGADMRSVVDSDPSYINRSSSVLNSSVLNSKAVLVDGSPGPRTWSPPV